MKALQVSKTTTPTSIDYKYSTAGTYTIDIPFDGDYEFELVGGGCTATVNNTYASQGLVGCSTGGGGGYFKGTIRLTAGTYTLVVGPLANAVSSDANETYFYKGSDNSVNNRIIRVIGGSRPEGYGVVIPSTTTIVGSYSALTGGDGATKSSVSTNYGPTSGGTGWTIDGVQYGYGQSTKLVAGPTGTYYQLGTTGGSGGYARYTVTVNLDQYVLNGLVSDSIYKVLS